MATMKRINKEWNDITTGVQHPGISASPMDEANLFIWKATIDGLEDTPFEGGVFCLSIALPAIYPFKPPKMQFTTRIYHPNVSEDGLLNLDILGKSWSPALTILRLLQSVQALMYDPNPDDPLVPDIARLYKTDRDAYIRKAKEWTRTYAMLSKT